MGYGHLIQLNSTLLSARARQLSTPFRFFAEYVRFNSFRFPIDELSWNRFANLNRAVQVWLGPILFLCYINDIADNLSCNVSLYADDTLLYQTVDNSTDARKFQENINAVHEWSKEWEMPFNDKKCHTICFGSKSTRTTYTLGNSPLDWTDSIKYLGVIIQSDRDTSFYSRRFPGKIWHVTLYLQ